MKPKKRYVDMTARELAKATHEFDQEFLGKPKPMNAADRKWFDAWQKKALANEAKQNESLTLVFPHKLIERIGEVAKQKRTTPANLVKKIVQDALCEAVA